MNCSSWFQKGNLVSIWIVLFTSKVVVSEWLKCYGNFCTCTGVDYDYEASTKTPEPSPQDTQLKNLDKTKCSCLFAGHGEEMNCYGDETEKATCMEVTKFKSTGQVVTRHCSHQPAAKVLELGCQPHPEMGPEAEICECAEPFCNVKFKNDLPERII